MRLTVTEEQRLINAKGAAELLAALDQGGPVRRLPKHPRAESPAMPLGGHAGQTERQRELVTQLVGVLSALRVRDVPTAELGEQMRAVFVRARELDAAAAPAAQGEAAE